MNNTVQDYLKQAEDELSEWKETLGDGFPEFLNHILVARLLKAEDEIRFLRSRIFHMESR